MLDRYALDARTRSSTLVARPSLLASSRSRVPRTRRRGTVCIVSNIIAMLYAEYMYYVSEATIGFQLGF